MGKSTVSMVMFNSFLCVLLEGIMGYHGWLMLNMCFFSESLVRMVQELVWMCVCVTYHKMILLISTHVMRMMKNSDWDWTESFSDLFFGCDLLSSVEFGKSRVGQPVHWWSPLNKKKELYIQDTFQHVHVTDYRKVNIWRVSRFSNWLNSSHSWTCSVHGSYLTCNLEPCLIGHDNWCLKLAKKAGNCWRWFIPVRENG